jgi:hypothetical protein
MVNEPTVRKLYEMRLTAMAESFQKQLLDPSFQELTFEERFGMLVDLEWSRRKNNRLATLIRKADFQQSNASIEDVEYHADRKLDRTQILRLATGAYIRDKLNIIIMGNVSSLRFRDRRLSELPPREIYTPAGITKRFGGSTRGGDLSPGDEGLQESTVAHIGRVVARLAQGK